MTNPNTKVREILDSEMSLLGRYEDLLVEHREILKLHLLREISDKSHEISENLNLISSYLQGIEMNTRPKP